MRVLTRLKMNNATWERFKALSATPGANPFFTAGGSYLPYQGAQIEVDNDLPEGVLEPVYADCPDPSPLLVARLQTLLDQQPAGNAGNARP